MDAQDRLMVSSGGNKPKRYSRESLRVFRFAEWVIYIGNSFGNNFKQ
jgi:hypothetical protein